MSVYTDTQRALGVCVAARIPVILWGAPGQGKSKVVEAIAAERRMHLETVLASIREPSDFAGLPVVRAQGTELAAPGWAQRVADATGAGAEALVFFDEATTAPPSVAAAMLRVVLDRVVGDLYLGDAVAMVLAANPPELAADGWDLPAPLANRLVHLDWELPAAVVAEGLAMGWPPTPVPTLAGAAAAGQETAARALVGAFLRASPQLTTVVPRQGSATGAAWPSPRSWEAAARLYGYAAAAFAGDDRTRVQRLLVTGAVGQAAAVAFTSWVADMDLPDPEAVLADPAGWRVPGRGDQVYAVLTAVMATVKSRPGRGERAVDRWNAAVGALAPAVAAGHSDVAVAAARMWRTLPAPRGAVVQVEHMRPLVPVLVEAGILPKEALDL